MDPIDIERLANNQFFSEEKTPEPVVAPPVIQTVDTENDYVVIVYVLADGSVERVGISYEDAPNADPLSLDNEQFYIDAILAV